MQTFELIHDISSSSGITQKVKAYLFNESSLFDSYQYEGMEKINKVNKSIFCRQKILILFLL